MSSSYNLIKKVIDGCRVEIDCIHLKLALDGLPSAESANVPKFHNNWFGKQTPEKFYGAPMILDVLLQNVVFCQTNNHWQTSSDLKALRKSQGDRLKDFAVFKHCTAKSFSVTLMPHPQHIAPKKKRHKKKFKKKYKPQQQMHTAVILLQNATLDLKFIFQRKASDGTIKTISIEAFFKKLDIFITENQYFDINYFIASLLYAQAQQYAFDNPHLTKDFEPSVSQSYSITAPSTSTYTQSKKDSKSESKNDTDDDEDKNAVEAHHLSAGKLLFDALSLCQLPRFQWNVCKFCKLYIFYTKTFQIYNVYIFV